MENLIVKIVILFIGMVLMGITAYLLEKSTREFEQAVDVYYEDIHSYFHDDED